MSDISVSIKSGNEEAEVAIRKWYDLVNERNDLRNQVDFMKDQHASEMQALKDHQVVLQANLDASESQLALMRAELEHYRHMGVESKVLLNNIRSFIEEACRKVANVPSMIPQSAPRDNRPPPVREKNGPPITAEDKAFLDKLLPKLAPEPYEAPDQAFVPAQKRES